MTKDRSKISGTGKGKRAPQRRQADTQHFNDDWLRASRHLAALGKIGMDLQGLNLVVNADGSTSPQRFTARDRECLLDDARTAHRVASLYLDEMLDRIKAAA